MSCRKKVYTTIKPSTAPGVAPTVLAQWEILPDGTTALVDPTTLTTCVETEYQTENVCYVVVDGDGTCFEGKCTIAIKFDCTQPEGSQLTMEPVGILAADGTTLVLGTAAGEATIVPCPVISTVSDEFCIAG